MRHPEIPIPNFEQATQRGLHWLVDLAEHKPHAKDWPGDLQAHYKLPLVFVLTNHQALASQQYRIAKELFYRDPGHFEENDTSLPYLTHCNFYRDWWLVTAANMLNDQTATEINQRIGSLQTDMGFRGSPDTQNTSLLATAVGGLTLLAAGELEKAKAAAHQVARMFRMQPHPNLAFYLNRDPSGRLIEDPSSAWTAFVPGQKKPIYYVFGLSAYLLASVAGRYNDSDLLQSATDYYLYYTQTCGMVAVEHPYCGKIGLASSMLYKLTGNPEFKHTAATAANYLIHRQSSDGKWSLEEFIKPDGSNALPVETDRTAEFVILLSAINANLNHANSNSNQ